jgi:hypothetical protein
MLLPLLCSFCLLPIASGCQWVHQKPNQVERFTGAFSITADPPNNFFFSFNGHKASCQLASGIMEPMVLKTRASVSQIYRMAQRSSLNQLKCTRAASSLSQKRSTQTQEKRKLVFDNRSPSLQDFLAQANASQPLEPLSGSAVSPDQIPYLNVIGPSLGRGRKFYIEVYGCQVR